MRDLNELPLLDLFGRLMLDGSLDRVLAAARDEDLAGLGDITTQSIIEPDRTTRAAIVAREEGIVAGLAALPALISAFDVQLRYALALRDGDRCRARQTLGHISGPLAEALIVERTMLNIIGRLSGIASLTRRFVEAITPSKAVICDTRKTTPGLRSLEKYAVRCGGGMLHRIGLHDAVLYKDNHLAHIPAQQLGSALAEAIGKARGEHDLRFVEVEADSLDQLRRVLAMERGLVDMVLLDNMSPEHLAQAVAMRDEHSPGVLLEASGGVTLQTVREIAETGVDRISVGALTHSAACLDVALEILPDGGDGGGEAV